MHQIETHGNQAAAVFGRVDAWHKLGTTLEGAFTAEQAMTIGHLGGWDVRKTPLATTDVTPDGVSTIEVPNKYATVRTNPFTGTPEALGVVGGTYKPIQNEAHCEILNRLVDESGAIFDTAGSLRGGRQVFVSLQLPRTLTIGGVDPIRTNIVALNSHDGTTAFRLMVTPVRVVCANTQAAAIRNHHASTSIRHTTRAAGAIAAARDALGITVAYVDAFEAAAERMIQQTTTDQHFRDITAQLFPDVDRDAPTRTRNAAQERTSTLSYLWHQAETQQNIAGTRWAAYQAITEYIDHCAPVRAKGDDATARALRVLTTDQPHHLKTQAWDLCNV